MIYDASLKDSEKVDQSSGLMQYNPAALKALANVEHIDGDGHQTADLENMIAHMFGHTPIGRGALGLPKIEQRGDPSYIPNDPDEIVVIQRSSAPTPERVAEELQATGRYENANRRSRGQEMRRSYFTPNNVLKSGIVP